MTLSSIEPNDGFWQHFLPGADGAKLTGVIDNWDVAVEAADGECVPALSSLGEEHPFYGASEDAVAIWRHPNMHGLNDQVTVFDYPLGSELSANGMGAINLLSPAGLFATSPTEQWTATEVLPHSTPNGHAIMRLRPVAGGGAPCMP